jgi:hypothetical protein
MTHSVRRQKDDALWAIYLKSFPRNDVLLQNRRWAGVHAVRNRPSLLFIPHLFDKKSAAEAHRASKYSANPRIEVGEWQRTGLESEWACKSSALPTEDVDNPYSVNLSNQAHSTLSRTRPAPDPTMELLREPT